MKKILLAIFVSVLFAACSLESRAALITFTDSLPATNVILSNSITANASIQVRNIGANATSNTRWVGTGFQAPTSTTLDRVTLYIFNDLVNAPALGSNMTISVVSLTSLTASPAAPYSPLISESATVPGTYALENYMTFDLATPVSLTAGSYYGFMVYFNSNASNRGINFTQSGNGMGGNATTGLGNVFFTGDQGQTYTNSSSPVSFLLQTVPEPATWGLLAFSLTAVVILRRRRRA